MTELFDQTKQSVLQRADLSLKGSIDEPIRPLVESINENTNYCTTSTCSGRITIIEKGSGKSGDKEGLEFHLRSHEEINFHQISQLMEEFSKSIEKEDGQCLWLKFEPFIAHILCSNLDAAKLMLRVALDSGCRNSGLTFTKNNSIFMVAIRSTSSMELPISCSGHFQTNDSFITFVCEESNRRMRSNLERLNKFHRLVKEILE